MTFSSSVSRRDSASPPGVDWRGARLVALLKRRLPLPPLPPRAATTLSPGAGQVLEHVSGLGVDHQRAGRHVDHQILAVAAVAIRAAAALAAFGLPVFLLRERRQAVDALGRDDDHAAAVAAVAAVGPAARNVLLAAKADAAVAAAAGLDLQSDAIDEHENCLARRSLIQLSGSRAADRRATRPHEAKKGSPDRGPPPIEHPMQSRSGRGGTKLAQAHDSLSCADDVDAATFAIEFDHAVDQREQRVVGALADAAAGVELRADLAHQDVAGDDLLAGEFLDAAPLAVRIAAVAAGALSLLMCHVLNLRQVRRSTASPPSGTANQDSL